MNRLPMLICVCLKDLLYEMFFGEGGGFLDFLFL